MSRCDKACSVSPFSLSPFTGGWSELESLGVVWLGSVVVDPVCKEEERREGRGRRRGTEGGREGEREYREWEGKRGKNRGGVGRRGRNTEGGRGREEGRDGVEERENRKEEGTQLH